MKNKIKKSIKYILVFASVFVFSFSSLCLSSSALGNEKFEFEYVVEPTLQWYKEDTNVWVDDTEPLAQSFSISEDGSLDKISIRWIDNYDSGKELDANYKYRIFFRFRLIGSNVYSDSISFDMRFAEPSYQLDSYTTYDIDEFYNVDSHASDTYGYMFYRNANNELKTCSTADYEFLNNGVRYTYPPPQKSSNNGGYEYDFHQCAYGFYSTIDQHYLFVEISNFSCEVLYNSVDKSDIENFQNQENQIIGDTKQGRDTAKNTFKNITNALLEQPKSIVSAGVILRKFVSIPFLNNTVDFALALGLFAFVVGMSLILTKGLSGGSGGHYKSPSYKGKYEK